MWLKEEKELVRHEIKRGREREKEGENQKEKVREMKGESRPLKSLA